MSHDHHHHGHSHEDLFGEFVAHLQPVLDSSKQAVYIYFGDEHKVCNAKFASLLGYASPEEWAETEGSFPQLFVDESSQSTLIHAFQNGMEDMTASTFKVSWKKKSGGTADSTVTLVPLSFQNHLFALHFVA